MQSFLPGMVPAFEEREAARFGWYNWRQWRRLEAEERADVVAHYRLHRLIELHNHDVVSREMKKRSKVK